MILAALPFVRYLQIAAGTARPLLHDSQIRAFLLVIAGVSLALTLWLVRGTDGPLEPAFRAALFNVVSILTGTGYASADYNAWGPFAMAVFFTLGLIGGCSGSTACSVKIFRYQLLGSAIVAEVTRLHSPNRVFTPRYQGRPVDAAIMSSVMAFCMFFYLALGLFAVALVLVGASPITAISGAATALANVGPGLGPEIGPAGNFAGLNDPAKLILSFAMLLGRLELLTVLVLFVPAFWRA
jgi:trk system potassium uptake protein TrkH